eukprot:g13329.t1
MLHEGVDESGAPIQFLQRVQNFLETSFLAARGAQTLGQWLTASSGQIEIVSGAATTATGSGTASPNATTTPPPAEGGLNATTNTSFVRVSTSFTVENAVARQDPVQEDPSTGTRQLEEVLANRTAEVLELLANEQLLVGDVLRDIRDKVILDLGPTDRLHIPNALAFDPTERDVVEYLRERLAAAGAEEVRTILAEDLRIFPALLSLEEVFAARLPEFADLLYAGNSGVGVLAGWVANNTVVGRLRGRSYQIVGDDQNSARFLVADKASVYELPGLLGVLVDKMSDHGTSKLASGVDNTLAFACRDLKNCLSSSEKQERRSMFPQMDFAADLSFSPARVFGHVVSTQKLIFFGPLSRNSPNVAQAKLAVGGEEVGAATAGGGELRVRVAEPKFCAGYADAHGSEIAPWLTILPGTSPLSHVGFVEGLPVAPYVVFTSVLRAGADQFYALRVGSRTARSFTLAAFSDPPAPSSGPGDQNPIEIEKLGYFAVRIGQKNFDTTLGPFSAGTMELFFDEWVPLPYDAALRNYDRTRCDKNPVPLAQIMRSDVEPAVVRMRRVGEREVQLMVHGCTTVQNTSSTTSDLRNKATIAYAVFPGNQNPPNRAPAELFPIAGRVNLGIELPESNQGTAVDLRLERFGSLATEIGSIPEGGKVMERPGGDRPITKHLPVGHLPTGPVIKVFVLPGVPTMNDFDPVVATGSLVTGFGAKIVLHELLACGADGVHDEEDVPVLLMQWKTSAVLQIEETKTLKFNEGDPEDLQDPPDHPFVVGEASLRLQGAPNFFARVSFARPFAGTTTTTSTDCLCVVSGPVDYPWDAARWRRVRIKNITNDGFDATVEQGGYVTPEEATQEVLSWWAENKDKWAYGGTRWALRVTELPDEVQKVLELNVATESRFPNGKRFWAGKLALRPNVWARVPGEGLQNPRVFATDASSQRMQKAANAAKSGFFTPLMRLRVNPAAGFLEVMLQVAEQEECVKFPEDQEVWVAANWFAEEEVVSVLVVEGEGT